MSLLFNMLSRLVIPFIPRNKNLLISWLQAPSAVILEPSKIKSVTVSHCFSIYFAMEGWDRMSWSSFLEHSVLRQLYHSLLSLSSRGSSVPLCFLPGGWCHLHIWGYWYFSWQSWFHLVPNPAQCFSWCTLQISLSRVTIYSLNVLLFLFGTSLLFYVQF